MSDPDTIKPFSGSLPTGDIVFLGTECKIWTLSWALRWNNEVLEQAWTEQGTGKLDWRPVRQKEENEE